MKTVYDSLSDFLPYEAYQDYIFYNRSTLGFCFLGLPIVGLDVNSHRQLTGIFQYMLPEGANIQYLLFADPYIGDTLEHFASKIGEYSLKDPKMMAHLARSRSSFFKERANFKNEHMIRPPRLFKVYLSVTVPLQEGGDFASEVRRLQELRSQVEETLKQVGVVMRPMDALDLIDFYDKCLVSNLIADNFKKPVVSYDPLSPLRQSMPSKNRKIQIQKDGLLIDDGASKFMSYSILKYPLHWNQSQMGSLIGDYYSDLQQIDCPFFIHYGVHIPKQSDLVMGVTAKASHLERQMNSPISKYLPKMRDELLEYQFVARQIAEGHRFLKTNMTIALVGEPSHMSRCESKLLNLYRGRGFELKREDYLHLQSFLTILPMSFGDDLLKELKVSKKLKTTISSEAANLLPLQGEWYGNSTPAMLFEGRRGQLLTWSPFLNNAGNYNVSVVGRSGSGKSVFMQELMTSTLRQNGKVFVLDVGRSFQKTCLLLGGNLLNLHLKILCV